MKQLGTVAALVGAALLATGCTHFQRVEGPADELGQRAPQERVLAEDSDRPAERRERAAERSDAETDGETDAEKFAREAAALRASLPATPAAGTPSGGTSTEVFTRAARDGGLRIVVSTTDRALWLMRDTTVVYRAPVAVGRTEDLVWGDRTYDFDTPPGVRKVLGKATDPIWTPPDWHYFELAVEHGLEPVHLKPGQKVVLGDGTRLEVRGNEVGRVNQFDNFWAFTPGSEIIFDGKIFVPPFGTNQRSIPEILGTHKLDLGDGYLIHGTNEDDSIGDAVSHGCVRMFNDDVAWLHENVPVNTPVYIF
jgi:lipoprotein-anchoring transpeptidase ErfK/SrfK